MAKKPKLVTCADCGKAFMMPYSTWRTNAKTGKPFRCKECVRKFLSEHTKQQFANMSEDEKCSFYQRRAEAIKNALATKSPEERRARMQVVLAGYERWLETASPESKEAVRIKRKATIDAKPEEERRASIEKMKATKAAKSPEEKQASIDKMLATFAAKSDDEVRAIREKMSESGKAVWRNKSEEERQAQLKAMQDGYKEWLETATDEEKETAYAPMHEARELWWESLSDEDKIQRMTNLGEGRDTWWASLSEEEKESIREAKREEWENKPEDEKEVWRERTRRQMASMSDDERKSRGDKVSASLLNRTLEDKLATAEKFAEHDRDKTPGHISQWFQTMFEQCYGTKYQLVRENPFVQSNVHRWDYTVIENGVPLLLVDIDECGVHGGGSSEYGRCSLHEGFGSEQRDCERGLTIPDGIPFMVILEECKESSFKDLTAMLGRSYEEYIQWMYRALRSQPFPYPSYSNKEILSSYSRLCRRLKNGRKTPGIMALDGTNWDCLYGQHIMYHFYHSIWHDSIPGKTCPHDAFMNDDILMDMIRKRYILHVRNRNKITQCFLLSEEAPRVAIFTPIMGMKVIHKYCNGYNTIVDCNTQYGGVLLASLTMGKKYIGYDQDLAHHNESVKLINWFPTVGITVDAQMLDHVPSGPCMCSYVPFGDGYIDELLQRANCSKYILIVPGTERYKSNILETYTTDDHWGTHEWHVLGIDK